MIRRLVCFVFIVDVDLFFMVEIGGRCCLGVGGLV